MLVLRGTADDGRGLVEGYAGVGREYMGSIGALGCRQLDISFSFCLYLDNQVPALNCTVRHSTNTQQRWARSSNSSEKSRP